MKFWVEDRQTPLGILAEKWISVSNRNNGNGNTLNFEDFLEFVTTLEHHGVTVVDAEQISAEL